jgi:dihydroflavonol-4-reductase
MVNEPAAPVVLVTGANGFVALHTMSRLLELGYRVRGTVRSSERERDVQDALSRSVGRDRLSLVRAVLTSDENWAEATTGCDFVLHLASPAPLKNPRDNDELVVPAREGTLRVLRAAQAARVKRVVMLSSMAAVVGGHQGENRTFDDSDWAKLETANAYQRSKALAERAAWNLIQTPGGPTELTSVNPSYVFGPVLDRHYFASSEWILALMRRDVPGVPDLQLHFVDVRDVVDLMIRAMLAPAAAGKRLLASANSLRLREIALILERHFRPMGYRIPTRVLHDVLVRCLGLLVPKVRRSVVPNLGWSFQISTEQTKAAVGWTPRAPEETLVEMVRSLIALGVL